MAPKHASLSASPERDDDEVATTSEQVSTLPEEVWSAMLDVLNYVYDFRGEDNHDPSKIFHRKVNKRLLPDYYDIIKEPIALSTIKSKVNAKEYLTFQDFVRDFALVPHNAFVYNLPDSGAYQDALVIKQLLEEQLKKLVDAQTITETDGQLPYLGEIPAADEQAVDDEDEDEEEEDDDDDEPDEELGDEPPKKRGRGRPRKSSIIKREAAAAKEEKNDDPETRKKRGRPPKVLTPTEHRIQTVLKGIRKPKNDDGQALIANFERLPDKTVMPEYFQEIKNPVAYDVLKRKYKRKKYPTLDHFMRDVDLMFENAKQYNTDESEIYKDAVRLQAEAHRLADEVKARPDTEYVGDEGRIPMPEGILHNGELYKTGDWVFIQNANDLTKPIPTQIYRTYQDAQGGKWLNVCWYYRPEQTVHRFDKHFFEGEISKTGQYRDHRIDEIVGRCFIMFVTRYFKGRPASIAPGTEVFVCESRYNEEKHTFNKIKTWASCLPDEVRDKDYAMEQFPTPRRMKKYPSPITYLLKDEQKETDDLPKPEWGADNAPPKIGAVHRRPKDPKDSPPPEPTPPPPPTPPPAPVQRVPEPPPRPSYSPAPTSSMQTANMTNQQSPVRPSSSQRQSYPGVLPQQYQQQAGSPGSALQTRPYQPQQQYTANASLQSQQSRPSQPQQIQPQPGSIPSNPYLRADASSYRGPAPPEVYVLPDAANYSIPVEIRGLFQRDEADRVLFFTVPPSYSEDETPKALHPFKDAAGRAVDSGNTKLGHSARYLAAKSRRAAELAKKKADYEREQEAQDNLDHKRKADETKSTFAEIDRLKRRAVDKLSDMLQDGLTQEIKSMHGQDWEDEVNRRLQSVQRSNANANSKALEMEKIQRERIARAQINFGMTGIRFEEAQQ